MVDVLWYCVITIYKYVHLASVKSIFFIYVAKQKQHASAFIFPFAGNLDNLLMFSLYRKNLADNVLSYLIRETGFLR